MAPGFEVFPLLGPCSYFARQHSPVTFATNLSRRGNGGWACQAGV